MGFQDNIIKAPGMLKSVNGERMKKYFPAKDGSGICLVPIAESFKIIVRYKMVRN
jgi:hypothetical protein